MNPAITLHDALSNEPITTQSLDDIKATAKQYGHRVEFDESDDEYTVTNAQGFRLMWGVEVSEVGQ